MRKVTYHVNGKPVAEVHQSFGHVASIYTRKIGGDDVVRIPAGELAKVLAKLGVKECKAPFKQVTLPNGVKLEAKAFHNPKIVAAPTTKISVKKATKKVAAKRTTKAVAAKKR